MDQKIKSKVNKYVRSRYPNLEGINPKIAKQANSDNSKNNFTFVFTYKGFMNLAGNKKIPIVVRAVCTEDGKILKLSSSK